MKEGILELCYNQVMRRNKDFHTKLFLFFVILIGFLLRVNHWFDFLGADEIGWKGLITWTWGFHKDPFPIHYYPPFFLYLNFVFSLILKKLTIFLGIIDFNNIFLNSDFGYIFTLKTGRIMSALFGTLNIYMIYLIGKEFFNKYAGLISAVILSVFWPHVIDSHNFKSDILLTLLITVLVYFSLKFLRTKNKWHLFFASFFLGLSVASKFNGAFFIVMVIVPIFYVRKEMNIFKNLYFAAIGGILGFFLGAPNWLIHPFSNFKVTLEYLKGLSAEVAWYDPFPSSFLLYGKNFIEHFGIILVFILVVSLIISLAGKDKFGKVISISVLTYFILVAIENYLNYRALLPLIPLVSLLIGKLIFRDVETLLNKVIVRRIAIVLLTVPVLIYATENLLKSYKSFDLLKGIASHPVHTKTGIGEPDYSAYYLKNNIKKGSMIFREMWTPPAIGYGKVIFGRDVVSVPEKKFKGDNSFNFLITSFRTDYLLRKAKNRKFADAAKRRMRNYLPFYKVYRPAIFTWSDDIQFWYRKPDYVKGFSAHDNGMYLPALFVKESDNDSVFLPVKRYEKNPCNGKIMNGISGKYIFSRKPIKEIIFHYVAKNKLKLIINVNGSKIVSSPGKGMPVGIAKISDLHSGYFGNTAIRRLYEVSIDSDEKNLEFYIYKIEIKANMRNEIPYVFRVDYSGNSGGNPVEDYTKIIKDGNDDIPELFGNRKTPGWIKNFYKKNGIDLLLLSYINTQTLFDNPVNSLSEIDSEYFPVERGAYILEFKIERIIKSVSPGTEGNIGITMITDKNKREFVYSVVEGSLRYRFKCGSNIGFIRFKSTELRENNLLMKKIIIKQDFKSLLTVSN